MCLLRSQKKREAVLEAIVTHGAGNLDADVLPTLWDVRGEPRLVRVLLRVIKNRTHSHTYNRSLPGLTHSDWPGTMPTPPPGWNSETDGEARRFAVVLKVAQVRRSVFATPAGKHTLIELFVLCRWRARTLWLWKRCHRYFHVYVTLVLLSGFLWCGLTRCTDLR